MNHPRPERFTGKVEPSEAASSASSLGRLSSVVTS
jgi:hypothetical protein